MSIAQSLLAYFISPILSLIVILIFAQVILSWLVGFGIVNLRNPLMSSIYQGISRFVEPICGRFKKLSRPWVGLTFRQLLPSWRCSG